GEPARLGARPAAGGVQRRRRRAGRGAGGDRAARARVRHKGEDRVQAAAARGPAAHPRRRVAAESRSRLRAGHDDRARPGRRGRVDARALSGERPLSAAPRITVLVPAWNEAESIPVLHREVVAALEALGQPWEVIYVDDGSRDGTDQAIAALAAADPRVRG